MRRIFRIIEFSGWLLKWAIAITLLCAMCSCTSVQYVPVETVRTDSVRVVNIRCDSIYVLDSIFVRETYDTIYITKWRVEYREALRIDTFNIVEVDSVNTIVEVEKKLSKWQQAKMNVGTGVLYAVPILIAVGLFVLYRKMKK